MNQKIRNEINRIEESTLRLKTLARDNPAILKNAEIILAFVYILKFITPDLRDLEISKFLVGGNEWKI